MTDTQQDWDCLTCNKSIIKGKYCSKSCYYVSLKTRRGSLAPNWKGESAGVSAKHSWLDNNFGKPKVCENKQCLGITQVFEWCLKPDKQYSHNREDYLRLCRSCHRKLDKIKPKPHDRPHSEKTKEKIRQKVRTYSLTRNRKNGLFAK